MKEYNMPESMKLFCEANQKSISHCDWYMHKSCPETCEFAHYILGVGAADLGTIGRIQQTLERLAEEEDDGEY